MSIHQKDLTRSPVRTPFEALSWNKIRCWRSLSKWLIHICISYNDSHRIMQSHPQLREWFYMISKKSCKQWHGIDLTWEGGNPRHLSSAKMNPFLWILLWLWESMQHMFSKNELFFQQRNKCHDVISFCPRWAEDMEALNSSSECWASENCKRRNSEQYLFPLFLELMKLPWKRKIYFYSKLDSDKQKVFEENSLLGRKT